MQTADRSIQLVLRVDGEPVPVRAPQPPVRARLDQLLPAQRAVDDAAIDHAVRKAQAAGLRVACSKGCSACCRAQPVPVTPQEAYALLRLVEAQAPALRATLEARFVDRVRRLQDAGLAELLLERPPGVDTTSARAIAQAYFALQLACPFLQDDACSIHPHRPFVCRQYLVGSDPALCADPFANPVEVIPVPLRAANAALAIAQAAYTRAQHTVPLVLALAYARRHRAELERRFAAEPMFVAWLQALAP
jgi:Fe-S-cluster containining protein